MEQFLRQLQTIPEAAELIRRVEEGGCPAAVSGLQPVQRACVGAAVAAACIGAGGVGAGAGVYLHSRQAAIETDADETAAEESENREEREEIEETSLAAQEDGPVQVEQNT